VDASGANPFNPSQHSCIDNCEDGYACNMNSCICEREEHNITSCGARTGTVTAAPPPFDPSTTICLNDCPPRTYCEPTNCVCKPQEVTYCADGGANQITPDVEQIDPTLSTAGTSGGGTYPADSFFDVFVDVELPGGDFSIDSFFDVETELNVSPPNVSPGTRTGGKTTRDSFFDVFVELDVPTLSPTINMSTMICEDNCEVLGPEFKCDETSCVCEYEPVDAFSCFSNTKNVQVDPTTGDLINDYTTAYQCRDDCEKAEKRYGGTWALQLVW
jgi:hypothetical protein